MLLERRAGRRRIGEQARRLKLELFHHHRGSTKEPDRAVVALVAAASTHPPRHRQGDHPHEGEVQAGPPPAAMMRRY